jgi:hypothetical protein
LTEDESYLAERLQTFWSLEATAALLREAGTPASGEKLFTARAWGAHRAKSGPGRGGEDWRQSEDCFSRGVRDIRYVALSTNGRVVWGP